MIEDLSRYHQPVSTLFPRSTATGDWDRYRLRHDQLFCKPARHGGVVAWHQDYSYWTRTTPLAHLTCWIGLDDSTRENGCLNYVPGSHKWPDLPKPVLTGEMNGIRDSLPEDLKE